MLVHLITLCLLLEEFPGVPKVTILPFEGWDPCVMGMAVSECLLGVCNRTVCGPRLSGPCVLSE